MNWPIALAAVVGTCFTVPAADAARAPERRPARTAGLDSRFEQARSLARQGRYDEAEAEFSRLVEARPGNADFLLGLAQARLWRGAPEAALPPLRQARRLAPDYEDVWRTQILALLALGDADRLRQARIIRAAARQRFPGSDWHFTALDGAPATLPPAVAAPSPPAAPGGIPPSQVPEPEAMEKPGRQEWELGLSFESLTHDLPAWSSRYLRGEWQRSGGRALYGGLRETERYGLADREILLGGVVPVGAATSLQFEAGGSATHRALPARYAFVRIEHRPAAGWALGAGLRPSAYEAGDTLVADFGIDRYSGAERFGYTLYLGGPAGHGPSPSHRWQWAHYYRMRDWIGLTLIHGRETEYAGTGFLTSPVRGLLLSGRHDLAPDWALAWEAGSVQQGSFYTRRGVRLGLRHTF